MRKGIHSGRDVDDDNDDDIVLLLPSSQLAELDQAYKSGGQDAARQLLQSQSMEQVYIPTSHTNGGCMAQFIILYSKLSALPAKK